MTLCDETKDVYLKWKEDREETVKTIQTIARELQRVDESRSAEKSGDVSTGLAIAGVLAAPFTMGLSLGLVTAGAGAGIAKVSMESISRKVVESQCRRAKELLETDQGKTEKLVSKVKAREIMFQKFASQDVWVFLKEIDKVLTGVDSTYSSAFDLLKSVSVINLIERGEISAGENAGKVQHRALQLLHKGKAIDLLHPVLNLILPLPMVTLSLVNDIVTKTTSSKKVDPSQLKSQASELLSITRQMEEDIKKVGKYFEGD